MVASSPLLGRTAREEKRKKEGERGGGARDSENAQQIR